MNAIRVWHPACASPMQSTPKLPVVNLADYPSYAAALAHNIGDEGLLLFEHDISADVNFAKRAWKLVGTAKHAWRTKFRRQRVFSFTYPLYPKSTGLPEPVFAHRINGEFATKRVRYSVLADACGFGCVYLPPSTAEIFSAGIGPEWDYPALDTTFCRYWRQTGGTIVVLPEDVKHCHQ